MRTPSYLPRLQEAVKSARSYADVFRAIGVSRTVVGSGNYRSLKTWIRRLGLDTSHFSRQLPPDPSVRIKEKTKDVFVADNLKKGKMYGTHMRKGIIKHELLPYKCVKCGNDGKWHEDCLVLQIDHIDGDHTNNELSNLRFLCPNCHSQTETFAGAKNRIIKPKPVILNTKPRKTRSSSKPAPEVLREMVISMPMTRIATYFMVSDTAVRKWCRTYAIDYKTLSPFAHRPRLSGDMPDLQNPAAGIVT